MPKRPDYEVAHLSEISHTPTEAAHGLAIPGEWKQIRHHFGIREFSANAFVATEVGQEIVHEHSERANDDPSKPGDEELYFVASGRVLVRLGDEEVEADAGTLVFVGEPRVVRSFTALEAGTTILTFGTKPARRTRRERRLGRCSTTQSVARGSRSGCARRASTCSSSGSRPTSST
jgi:mannose-6-phosphate isomerase-like protein (cupin superfamily)